MKKDRDLQEVKVKHALQFKLTQEEYAVKARQMAACDRELGELNVEFEEVKNEWKGKLSLKHKERANLSRVVRDGFETRTVECVEIWDFTEGLVRYVYEGEVMLERVITAQERQAELDLRAKKKIENLPTRPANEISETIREETNGRTKHSAVDGPSA